MNAYSIKPGYQINLQPKKYEDTFEDSDIYQVDVYCYAAEVVQRFACKRVLDVGCGVGNKLAKYLLPTGVDITGVDEKYGITLCRETHLFGNWVEDNIEEPSADLGGKFDFIISADVIEHLIDPDALLKYFKLWSNESTKILVSTPERDLRRGVNDLGPPGNGAHVREWNNREFISYLESRGLKVTENHIVELKSGMVCCQMVLCRW